VETSPGEKLHQKGREAMRALLVPFLFIERKEILSWTPFVTATSDSYGSSLVCLL